MLMPKIPALSQEQFETLLEEIDSDLDAKQHDIRGRDVRSWMLFCQRLSLSGLPLSHPLSAKVTGWFKTRYGERLNIDFSFGHSILVLRNSIIRFRCALFYGSAILFCAPEDMLLSPTPPAPNRPALVNILRQLDGITPDFAFSLSPSEQENVLETYVTSQIAFAWIDDTPAESYIREARGDLAASAAQLLSQSPQFGLSKWSSLQAVEKFLKSFIVQNGAKHKFSHDLSAFAGQAVKLGLTNFSYALLSKVQCPAGVRYGETPVSKDEAVEAHHAALSLCAETAKQLPRCSQWQTRILNDGEVNFGPKVFKAIQVARTFVGLD
jgi:hypothetical protein